MLPNETAVLYTSLLKDGAMAEIAPDLRLLHNGS